MTVKKRSVTVEVCCSSPQDVRGAVLGGADRIELCSALATGGVTPSAGLIYQAVRIANSVPVMVLIRPRDGHFVYDEAEVLAMELDIAVAHRLGAYGVVIGALTADGEVDVAVCKRLIKAAKGLNITFSRAIDVANDPMRAFNDVAGLKVDRILTSGGAPTALQGAEVLRQMTQAAGPEIMAGGGVSAENVAAIIKETGVSEIHGSFRGPAVDTPQCRKLPGLDAPFRHTSDKIVQKVKECIG